MPNHYPTTTIPLKERASALLHLIFPKICMFCGHDLIINEVGFCRFCTDSLPYTNFHRQKANKIEQLFWGRIPIEQATSFLYFTKGGVVQKLLHVIKYQQQTDLAIKMGEMMARQLQVGGWLSDIDLIVPVPLHPKKQKQRGYNQSEMLARGFSSVTKIPIDTNLLKRSIYTSTQTRKGRYDRYLNMDSVFGIDETDNHVFRHILIIDDVITTGATLEGCAMALQQIHGARISIATLAFAKD
jgi:ComF family protein